MPSRGSEQPSTIGLVSTVSTGLGGCDGSRRQTTLGAGGGVVASGTLPGAVSAGATAVLYAQCSVGRVAVMLRALTMPRIGDGWTSSISIAGMAGRFLRSPSVSSGGKMGALSVGTI